MKLYKPLKEKFVKPNTNDNWIKTLPFIETANRFGIQVRQFYHPHSDYNGFYDPDVKAIWLHSMSPRIFLHELAHVADDRNYTLSHSAPPEVFLSEEIMLNYVRDEVVAEWSSTLLLQSTGLSPRSAERGNAQEYIKTICEVGNLDWIKTINSCEDRIEKVMEMINSRV